MTIVGSSLDFAIYYKGFRVGAQNVAVDFEKRVVPVKDEHAITKARPTIADQPAIDPTPVIEHQQSMRTQPAVDGTPNTYMGIIPGLDDDQPMTDGVLVSDEDSGSDWEP